MTSINRGRGKPFREHVLQDGPASRQGLTVDAFQPRQAPNGQGGAAGDANLIRSRALVAVTRTLPSGSSRTTVISAGMASIAAG
ncbi:MAG: hypothetical protein ACJ8H8_33830, partial [Geminicoccaceae bacterium]